MKKILAILLVLTLGVFTHAQFDMQRSPNNGTESNPIRPEITNDLSHLGAAYTLGTEAGNLTGNYGDYIVIRVFPKRNPNEDIGVTIASYDAKGNQKSIENVELELGICNTFGIFADFGLIINKGKLFYQFFLKNLLDEKTMMNIDVFDMLGGHIDYVAISGRGTVFVSGFQFGNGWVTDEDNYGFTNMQTIHGYAAGFSANPKIHAGYTRGLIKYGLSGRRVFNYFDVNIVCV